jgi:hypothetical protein
VTELGEPRWAASRSGFPNVQGRRLAQGAIVPGCGRPRRRMAGRDAATPDQSRPGHETDRRLRYTKAADQERLARRGAGSARAHTPAATHTHPPAISSRGQHGGTRRQKLTPLRTSVCIGARTCSSRGTHNPGGQDSANQYPDLLLDHLIGGGYSVSGGQAKRLSGLEVMTRSVSSLAAPAHRQAFPRECARYRCSLVVNRRSCV